MTLSRAVKLLEYRASGQWRDRFWPPFPP